MRRALTPPRIILLTVVGIVVVVALVLAATVPSVRSTEALSMGCDYPFNLGDRKSETFPSYSSVSLRWSSTTSGSLANLYVSQGSPTNVLFAFVGYGNASFTSDGGTYYFECGDSLQPSAVATASLTVLAPIL